MQAQRNAEAASASTSLEITRRFDAPPERVFDAWLGVEWGQWLPPGGASCQVTTIEPRLGGRYRVTMNMPDGRVVQGSGVYREVVRPSRLVFTWFADYNSQETLITVTFRPDGAGTMMSFRQDGFPSSELRDRYHNGWGGNDGSFQKLAAFLARSAR
jgi:uncharacterized protein YndB with AHSA1/START domain